MGSINCEAAALDQVKGWTRSSVLALLLIAAAEYDLGDPSTMDKLQPLENALVWLVPSHISVNMDTAKQSYRNLCLSYRGSERQPPNSLQLALRFSQIIEMRDKQGVHNKLWTPEQRLQEVVDEFNETSGLQQKHRVDAERFRSLLNLISGSCEESRQVLRQHLNHHKWRESAFSVEQFKGSRWLVGATPKSTCPPDMKQALTVTPESQRMHFELIVHTFVEGGRKLRPSARSRTRAAPEVFDRHADYACIFATILTAARQLSTWTAEKEEQLYKLFLQKAYFTDIEAAIVAKLDSWRVSHLAVWADYVEPKVPTITISDSVDIGIAEDEAQAARFREVRAKLSSDMMAMAQWNARQEENRKRAHVISVLHEKSQVETGKKLADAYMEQWCSVSLTPGIGPKSPEAFLKAAARVPRTWRVVTVVTVIELCQVSPLDVRLILYVDCTKFGVMTQKEVNDVADTVEKHLNYGAGGGIAVILPPLLSGSTSGGSLRQDWRRIEDKMAANKVELRQFTLNLDLSELHRNRELPAAYLCFLGVQDHALPMKGTAHRAVKGVPTSGQDGVKANSLPGIDLLPNFKACLRGMSNALTSNLRFCASPLWQKQALAVKDFPFAIQEKDFIIPGDSLLHSNDQRRNLTDFQETAQWLGGVGVPKAIFKSLLGDDAKGRTKQVVAVIHMTSYDGCAELACLQLGLPVMGSTPVEANFQCASNAVRNQLLQAWKDNIQPMDKVAPRYRASPAQEEMPVSPERPTLEICQHQQGTLLLPRDIRQHFLQCPLWGPEWRDVLKDFDKAWSVNAAKTVAAAQEKHGKALAEMTVTGTPGCTLMLLEDHALFVCAQEAVSIDSSMAFLAHGAGTWLLGDKATKLKAEHPEKGFECKWNSDEDLVVLEADGADSPPCTLRKALQTVEKGGLVDFTLGGHSVTRPPEVAQGHADDKFTIVATNDILWKANNVAIKSLKSHNVASTFTKAKLEKVLKLVWRIRVYNSDKTIAAAKPLWFLPAGLSLGKDECKRIV
ncbi:unnamed protein product [Effrenium voratum]|nr:unnamed protein product [Effrenium voratum]